MHGADVCTLSAACTHFRSTHASALPTALHKGPHAAARPAQPRPPARRARYAKSGGRACRCAGPQALGGRRASIAATLHRECVRRSAAQRRSAPLAAAAAARWSPAGELALLAGESARALGSHAGFSSAAGSCCPAPPALCTPPRPRCSVCVLSDLPRRRRPYRVRTCDPHTDPGRPHPLDLAAYAVVQDTCPLQAHRA